MRHLVRIELESAMLPLEKCVGDLRHPTAVTNPVVLRRMEAATRERDVATEGSTLHGRWGPELFPGHGFLPR